MQQIPFFFSSSLLPNWDLYTIAMLGVWTNWYYLWLGGGVVLIFYVLPRVLMVLLAKKDPGGDSSQGLVIFAESLRWASVPWGKASCAAGLRRAGFAGEFKYWKWHETWRAWLVLPVIADTKMLERRSGELAEFIIATRRENPTRAIHLIGYSCGGYIAVRALELLPNDIQVDSCVLLAAAFSPWKDLRPACRRVFGKMLISSSVVDFVVGLGTIITGTADRKHSPAIGMLGYHGPVCEKIVSIRWRPGMISLGHYGSHFSAAAEKFIAEKIAPTIKGG